MARNTDQSITGSIARWMPVSLALVVVLALAACSSDSDVVGLFAGQQRGVAPGSQRHRPTDAVRRRAGRFGAQRCRTASGRGPDQRRQALRGLRAGQRLGEQASGRHLHPQPAHDAGADRRGAAPLAAGEHRAHRAGGVAAGADRRWVARLRCDGWRCLPHDRRNGRSERVGCRRARSLQLPEGTSRRRHTGGLSIPRHL